MRTGRNSIDPAAEHESEVSGRRAVGYRLCVDFRLRPGQVGMAWVFR